VLGHLAIDQSPHSDRHELNRLGSRSPIVRALAVLLVVLLIAKDASHLGDRFIMRGLVQAACLFYGVFWLMTHVEGNLVRRYLVVFAYILVLSVSSCLSDYFEFSAWQVLSLVSVITFGVAVCEGHGTSNVPQTILRATGITYLVVCVLSIAGIWLMHDVVYDTSGAGGARFCGIFGKPGMMGSASGILLGIALFGGCKWRHFNRTYQLIAALAALSCLALTGARTFWVAAAVAAVIVSWFYLQNRFKVYGAVSALVGFVVLLAAIGDYKVSQPTQNEILRTESIENLSGRTGVWAEAMTRLGERPWFGYGFGAGGIGAVVDFGAVASSTPAWSTVPTLHDGYVQSLMDSGMVGTALYGLVIGMAVFRMMVRDKRKKHGAECFALVFLAVGNVGESVIFTASTFPSILFWYVAILAFSLRRNAGHEIS